MDKIVISFEINRETCRTRNLVCPFLRTRKFGTEFLCGMFEDRLFRKGDTGLLQRCSSCLDKYQ